MTTRRRARRWMTIHDALQPGSPASTEDRVAIAAALIEEEALMRTARLIAGDKGAPAWYVQHGGRFRFSEDGDHLMIQIPVPPSPLAGLL